MVLHIQINLNIVMKKLMEIFNLSNEELIRFKSIQGKSNHSALAFMYPRLLLARKLLTETGK